MVESRLGIRFNDPTSSGFNLILTPFDLLLAHKAMANFLGRHDYLNIRLCST